MQKVTITRVAVHEKNKDGVEYKDKNGKKFKKVNIQTDVHGESWLSSLAFSPEDAVLNLESGQEVTIVVEKNGDYLNFKMPSRSDLLEERIESLARRVAVLEGGKEVKKAPHYPTPEEEGIDVDNAGNW